MDDEKRKGDNPIPYNVNDYMNDAQRAELQTIEKFGWSIEYIRRPLFENTVVVVMNPDNESIGILEEDGRLNLKPNIEVRK